MANPSAYALPGLRACVRTGMPLPARARAAWALRRIRARRRRCSRGFVHVTLLDSDMVSCLILDAFPLQPACGCPDSACSCCCSTLCWVGLLHADGVQVRRLAARQAADAGILHPAVGVQRAGGACRLRCGAGTGSSRCAGTGTRRCSRAGAAREASAARTAPRSRNGESTSHVSPGPYLFQFPMRRFVVVALALAPCPSFRTTGLNSDDKSLCASSRSPCYRPLRSAQREGCLLDRASSAL